MNCTSWKQNRWNSGPRLLAVTLAAFLTACSTTSESDSKAEAVKSKVYSDYRSLPPDFPPHLVRCLTRRPEAGTTADQMVLNQSLALDERDACARNLLAWYKTVQGAGQKAPLKP